MLWGELSHLHREVGRRLGTHEKVLQDPSKIFVGPVLAEDEDPRVAYVRVSRGASALTAPLQWSLRVLADPRSPSSEVLRSIDSFLQGRRGLNSLLTRLLGVDAVPIGTYKLWFTLGASQWHCRLLPRPVRQQPVDALLLEVCQDASIEHLGYRLTNGANGLEELVLTYLHEEESFRVDAAARGMLRLTPEVWLPFANELTDLIVSRFFMRREEPS